MQRTSRRLEMFARAFRPVAEHPSQDVAVSAFAGSSPAFAAASLALGARGTPFVLVVTPGLVEADSLVEDLRVLEREAPVRALEFPPILEDDRFATAARLKVSAAIGAYSMRPYPFVVVAPIAALSQKLPAASAVADATLRLAAGGGGGTPPFAEVLERLAAAGYERVAEVTEEGQYSVRGGVVDAWPPAAERPARAEFFGDDLESLRVFDPATQVSVGRVESAEFPPVEIKSGETRTLLDVVPEGCAVLWLEHNAYPFGAPPAPRAARRIFTGDPAPRGVPTADFAVSPLPGFAELRAPAGAVDPALAEAVRSKLAAHLLAAERRGALVSDDADLAGGFEVPGLVVVAKSDRAPAARRARSAASAHVGARLSETFDLAPGELVVHLEHGVGRFLGSTEVEVNGARSEVFTIEYADGGKLYVPVEHAHLLSRYVGVKGADVKLHTLGGRRWTREKAAAQRAVQDLAAALLETQARRAVVPGFAYDVNPPGMEEFEAAFPYEETLDQARAIDDVKADLASQKPMDRLVCGDAGYGKTEVAMRAAFIAAMNGKQTVLLAPTTVLAEQHYESFLARFENTPVRIETLSRFVSNEAKKGVRARLLSGATDIVIGTHAVLSSKVAFHDLGLIVIDEEQRFGVRHKEFLKRIRATADVLTLSATPIPRTLYLSMTGARDLSLLRSPPRERVAVDTRIVRDSDEAVRAAVEAEIARGGQVYFLHNRVATIGRVERRLRALCPSAKIAVAHGQMDARTLAKKMRDFERGKFDVLLSTTIVESGIDIPRANTIVVDRADMFGLADLYQLRGRVGRSARQGYAYLLLPPSGIVDAEARERLSALRRHGGLGAGFNLAVRDLELRGAGNLLGSQQSGHIAAVGFGLYCQLLKRTIAMLKGEKVREVVDVKINLSFTNPSLSYEYIEEDAPRMSLMRRFAEAQDMRVVRALEDEMRDRFGPPPPEAKEFVGVASLRVACAAAGIGGVDEAGGRAVFYRAGSRDILGVVMLKSPTAPGRIAELIRAAVRTRRSRSP